MKKAENKKLSSLAFLTTLYKSYTNSLAKYIVGEEKLLPS